MPVVSFHFHFRFLLFVCFLRKMTRGLGTILILILQASKIRHLWGITAVRLGIRVTDEEVNYFLVLSEVLNRGRKRKRVAPQIDLAFERKKDSVTEKIWRGSVLQEEFHHVKVSQTMAI